MSTETNHSTRDLASSRLRLRGDLKVQLQDGNYVLEDPLAGCFFSLGAAEYRFLQLLDGSRSVAQVVGRLSVESDTDALTEEAAGTLLRSLADSNLLEGGGREHAERVRTDLQHKEDGKKMLQHGKSLLFCRIPLGNPDRLLDRILPWCGWLVSRRFFPVWCVVVIWGAASVVRNWNRFGEEMAGMFDAGNLFILGIIWILLKIFHEGCHALVCKRFGGSVPEIGMVLLLFVTPLGYVNASSATSFPSKWKRIFVSAAGIYGELFAAGLAAILWAGLDPGLLSRGLHEVIVISSVTTLLFNANPLMRFDGYYILSDLSGVANLYAKAQRSAGFCLRRWFLGANPERNPVPERDRSTWITAYGLAAMLWRFVVVFGIIAFVSHRWHGAGLIAGGIVVLSMLVSSIRNLFGYFRRRARAEEVSTMGTALRMTALLSGLVLLLVFVRINPGIRVPAVVDWKSDGEVRVECPGFLEEMYVANGDEVLTGDPVARIRNHIEEASLTQLRLDLKRSEILSDQFLQTEDISAYQAQQKQIAALKVRLGGLEEYVETLVLKAKCDGVVFAGTLDNLEGTYIEKGQLVCTIGRSDAKRLILAVVQDHADAIRHVEGSPARFRSRGRLTAFPVTLSRVNAHASTRIPHFGLIAPANGPLVTRRVMGGNRDGESEDADTRIRGDQLTRQFELTKPHFEVIADLDPVNSPQLEVGEVGYVWVHGSEAYSLGQWLRNGLDRAYRGAGKRE